MKTYKVFRAGNSKVVAIPEELAQRSGFDLGTHLIPQLSDGGILYKSVLKKSKLAPDLDKWLTSFEKKHGKALKELASK